MNSDFLVVGVGMAGASVGALLREGTYFGGGGAAQGVAQAESLEQIEQFLRAVL